MKNRRGGFLVSALILVLLAGNGAWSAELTDLKVNYSAIAGSFAPLWLAQDEGLFAKYGLKVDLKYIGAATEVQALVSQGLHIVNSGTELIDARLGGADTVYIGLNIGRFVFSLYSKPEIRSVADLRGKVVGATQPNSSTDFAIRILLQEAGITPGKDARILYVRGVPEIMLSLAQGVIEAGVLSAPLTLKARQAGLKELVDITGKNIPMIQSGIGSTGAFLKSNPEAVRRYF